LIAESPALPGFHTWGENREELLKNLEEVVELYSELLENEEIKIKLPH